MPWSTSSSENGVVRYFKHFGNRMFYYPGAIAYDALAGTAMTMALDMTPFNDYVEDIADAMPLDSTRSRQLQAGMTYAVVNNGVIALSRTY